MEKKRYGFLGSENFVDKGEEDEKDKEAFGLQTWKNHLILLGPIRFLSNQNNITNFSSSSGIQIRFDSKT